MKNSLFYFIAFLLFPFHCLKAQDFEVSPVVMQFKTNSGETETRTLTVKNYFTVKQKFTLSMVDYTLDADGVKHPEALGSTDRSLADRMIISPSVVELNPNESAEIEVVMTIPKTDAKTRWGMIRVQVAKEKTTADADKEMVTGVLVIPRIIVIVTQSPASNTNYAAKVNSIIEVEASDEGFRTFEINVSNVGDKVISGQLYLAVANLETAEEKRFPSKEVTLYPDANKNVILSIPEKLVPGQYALAALFDYGHQKSIEG
ncbi:MAG: hypothetical protein DRI54_09020, partial [Bacteroidetes bacterium]